MSDWDIITALSRAAGVAPPSEATGAPSPVQRTPEFNRIAALPRRTPGTAPDMTDALRAPTGTMTLRPLQSEVLYEAYHANGVLANIPVGGGKELTSFLLPVVLDAQRPLLLIPAHLREQVESDYRRYSAHFCVHSNLEILSYSEIGVESGADILEGRNYDCIVANEAHLLRNRGATRTLRVGRYLRRHPACVFCALSGTLTTRSIKDYAHLAEWALKKNSPLPLQRYPHEVTAWSGAIDVQRGMHQVVPPGALTTFCAPGEDTREGFRRRLTETPGVVIPPTEALGVTLTLRGVRPTVPKVVEDALAELRATWSRPDGEEFEEAARLAEYARQLACGFYYRWVWPNGTADQDWILARQKWHRFVRSVPRRVGLDSPALIERAVRSGELDSGTALEDWDAVRTIWRSVFPLGVPDTEAVWLSDYLVDYACEWANDGGLIWYEHEALGFALQARGITVIGGGPVSSTSLLSATSITHPTMALSRTAHGTGKNLQSWNRSLVLSPSANGAIMEQLFGREHRPGQLADEVIYDLCLQTPENVEALRLATEDAKYVEATYGQPQKLIYANRVGC